MRLKLDQAGPQVQVWISYRDSFGDRPFGLAAVQNNAAIWTGPQTCAPRFRSSGYDYSKPSRITVTLSWIQAADRVAADPPLLWTQDTEWNAPCGGHLIGTERIQKVLARE